MIVKSIVALAVATTSLSVPTIDAPTLDADAIAGLSVRAQAVEVARSYSEACVKYVDEVIKYDWEVETAIGVMWFESNCNPVAVNPRDSHRGCTGSFGLFQVACIHHDTTALKVPDTNVQVAYSIYSKGHWKPWGVCRDKIDCGI